jgi:hypothetical protein
MAIKYSKWWKSIATFPISCPSNFGLENRPLGNPAPYVFIKTKFKGSRRTMRTFPEKILITELRFFVKNWFGEKVWLIQLLSSI